MSENALVKLDAARRMLAEARTIDEIKNIRDKAEALRLYARQQQIGLEMQNDIAEIRLRAERRIGEMIAKMPKNKGTAGQGRPKLGGDIVSPPKDETPTLADVGISKKQASRWQAESELPPEQFEQFVEETKSKGQELTSSGLQKRAKKHKRERAKEKTEQKASESLPSQKDERFELFCGDFAEIALTLEPESVDVIITDPPYPKEYIGLYGILAEQAQRLLKPGGSLLAMAGQSYLPVLLKLMTRHIDYHWTLAYLTPGGQSPQIWARKVNTFWKPVLWFVKGKYDGNWHGDVIKSDVNDNDKRFHKWGQSESGMARLVEKFSAPGDLILDPFCGGGTTGVVSIALDRCFVGIDVDQVCISKTRARLFEVINDGERTQRMAR